MTRARVTSLAAVLLAVASHFAAAAERQVFARLRKGVTLDREFDLALSASCGEGAGGGGELQVVLNREGDRRLLLLDVSRKAVSLARIMDGDASTLGSADVEPWRGGGKAEILIKRRASAVRVVVNGRVAIEASEEKLSRGGLGLGARGGVKVTDARYQKVLPFEFSDDFMRADRAGDPWSRRSGEWRMAESPFPELFSGAFRMEGSAKSAGGALVLAGHDFWDDYLLSAAVQPGTGGAGVAFYARGGERLEFIIETPARSGGAGRAVLLRAGAGGPPQEISSRPAHIVAGRWHRVAAAVAGTDGRCFLDGQEAFRLSDRRLVGGRIGLAVRRPVPPKGSPRMAAPPAGRAVFDDVHCGPLGLASVEELDSAPPARLASLLAPRAASHLGVPALYASQRSIHPWAQPEAVWRQGVNNVLWHQVASFGDCRLRCVSRGGGLTKGEIGLTVHGDGEKANSGYHLVIRRDPGGRSARAALHKRGKLVAETEVDLEQGRPTKELELGFSCRRSAAPPVRLPVRLPTALAERLALRPRDAPERVSARLTALIDGARVFDIKDTRPIMSGRAGAYVRGRRLMPGSLELIAPGSTDTMFNAAPVDWVAASGDWRTRSRWSCQPEHTWYGCGPGVAVLWSKRRMPGDCAIDFYGALRMAERRMPFYDRPVNICCAISADGRDPASGYALYFGGTDTHTYLLRDGVVVADSSAFCRPSVRSAPRETSNVFHGTWWRLSLERRGDTVTGCVNGRKLVEYRDAKPLAGDRACIFAAGRNGLMLPRVRISSATAGLASPFDLGALDVKLRPRANGGPAPQPLLGRFAPPLSEGSAGVGALTEDGKVQFLFVNWNPGGDFARTVEIPGGAVDLARTPVLEMDLERSPASRVDLLARAGGRHYRVRLWGPDDDGPAVPLVDLSGRVRGKAEARISVNLLEALSGHLPRGASPRLEGLWIGCFGHETLLAAGLTGNRAGDWVLVKNTGFSAGAAPEAPAEVVRRKPGPGDLFVDDFEPVRSRWLPFGGAQSAERERVPSARGGWCLRMRSAEIGSVLGAEWPVDAYDARDFPVISFDYRTGPLAQVDLYLETAAGWRCVEFTDPSHGRPPLGAIGDVRADGRWHPARFDVAAAMRAAGMTDTVVRRVVFCNLGANGMTSGAAWYLDNARIGGGRGGRRRVAAPRSAPVRAAAPEAPHVSCIRGDAVIAWTFEPGEPGGEIPPGSGAPSARRGALATIDRERSATGGRSLAVMKRRTGYYSAYLSKTPFSAAASPVVELDVMMPRGAHGGLMFPVNSRFHVVELLGGVRESRLGSAGEIADDGRWRHVRFDLADMMRQAGLDVAAVIPYVATRRTSRPRPAEAADPDACIFMDNFQVHSGRSRKVRFMWKLPRGGEAGGYSYALDRRASTVPDEETEGTRAERTYDDLAPGRWYFHVRAVDAAGRWGPPGHLEVEVRR